MLKRKQKQLAQEMRVKMPEGLYANMNKRKKKGISRSKKNSTISDKAYKNMKAGFPKKKTLLKKDK
tara:strand:- start:5134 stop:5331 length:198 start_codon:yes stop_codon:yes gene_type:complete